MAKPTFVGTTALLQSAMAREVGPQRDELLRPLLAQLFGLLSCGAELGPELFNMVARQVPTIAVEVPVFRLIGGEDCVFLRRREAVESYAGLLHVPGTVWRSTDLHYADVLARLGAKEYGLPGGLSNVLDGPIETMCHLVDRGGAECVEWSHWLLGSLEGEPPVEAGKWYAVSEACGMSDEDIVHWHPEAIKLAYFLWNQNGRP